MKPQPCSIYSLTCPVENKIKYIGISDDLEKRYTGHIQSPSKTTKEWIFGLKAKGLFPVMKQLELHTSKWDAQKAEKVWINKIEKEQGGLLNISKNDKYKKTVLPPIEYLPLKTT